jgi:MarR family transcriptional regulator, transcriptional regulator for hemolysin
MGNCALTQVISTESKAKPGRRKAPGPKAARAVDKASLMAEFEVERTLGWLFHDINRLLGKEFEGRIKGLGLTRAQWRVLGMLRRTGGGQTQTELADLTEIEKAPLGKTLDRLEEGGWIVREDDPKDRRARRVYATAKIEKFLPQLAAAMQGMFARTLQGMRQGEVKDLIARLTMLKRNLGGAED